MCDLGGSNRALLNEIGISVHKSWFPNPVDPNRNIFVFADVPHLIKLIRNNFVDHGFTIDGKDLNKSIVEELLAETNEKSDLSIAYKISSKTLNVKNADRQKVKYATKLFSRTVAAGIARGASLGKIKSSNALACSEFFELVIRAHIHIYKYLSLILTLFR